MFEKQHQSIYFFVFLSVFWFISTYFTEYYKVYRYSSLFRVLGLLLLQIVVFSLGFFAFFGVFKEGIIVNTQFKTIIFLSLFLSARKIFSFYALKIYRARGNNYRRVVFFEKDTGSKKMISLFTNKKGLGYIFLGYFSNLNSNSNTYLGDEKDLYEYITSNDIDEVYAAQSQLTKNQIKKLTKFTSFHNIQLKLIPNSKEFYSKKLEEEFYDDTLKVLSVKKLPFDFVENRIIKRIFDIVFSLFVMLFVLSWLIPVLWILVKLESKGPLFFKQKREGLNGKKFTCYKFRSMKLNKEAHEIHATKNDYRITKIGAFIRKTSIDELPQFLNVLLGDMSVVGPRPHMESLSTEYQKDVDNYIERHAVKPGITGLAQVSGYRGEIKKKSDIKNRVRLDIFYIENWSFLLDIKIIIKTVLNVFKGDENAY
ncbi:exopolysaccharide biosynthesis polyprenyl glycosylphosphotransferase [Tenacibaculum sp. IB213877]|nr:exopolysaccharide biosynthesis polyprenyl glycosylphosphotransferase [Tenacibaculum sp. IB213877]MDY0780412.1 exopolysaccharide biosynthesis polyprenyl glycosylphosphotransferase [Tenacibaculum sp. IB213877]